MRRTIAAALTVICLAGGSAGCSSGSGGSSAGGTPRGGSASGNEQVVTVLRQLARCIRSHGMPGWPDPVINPLTGAADFPPGAPRVSASIQQACQTIANRLPPNAQSSQPPTATSMQALLRFARCMRARGISNWPDPNALGEFPMTTQMSIQFKVADRSATSACIRYVPGGSQYLQFVGAPGPQPAPGGNGNG